MCESECVFSHYGISGTPDTSLKCSLCAIKDGGVVVRFSFCACVYVCARGAVLKMYPSSVHCVHTAGSAALKL